MKLVNKNNAKESHFVRIALMPLPNKGFGYKKEWYLEWAEYEFEGYMLSGVKNYHDFLTYEFGDYMKMPPIEKRKVHPVSKIKVFENELYKEKKCESSDFGGR
jgi:lipopolysaccharide cholinephosphotransferase